MTAEQRPSPSLPPEQTLLGPEAELCCLDKELGDNSDEDVVLPFLWVFTGEFRCSIFHFAQIHQGALFVHKIDEVWRERHMVKEAQCAPVWPKSMWSLEVFSLAGYTLNRICGDLGSGRFAVPFPVFRDVL